MKPRRLSKKLDDMPGLFDNLNIDFDPDKIAGEREMVHHNAVIARARTLESGALRVVDNNRSLMRFLSFGSGSSGNCYFVGSLECGVLIDAGVDADIVDKGLAENGIDPHHIAGIFITHDHGDHVHFAYTLLRRHPHMQLFATPRAFNGILRRHNISRRIKDYHKPVFKEFPVTIGSMQITPFETAHDGTDNVGYAIQMGDHTFVVVTDTGHITERSDFYIRQANHLVIEANYDSVMLARCNRPEYVKARIRSDHGHMDNVETAAYLAQIWTPTLTDIYLCHLSEDTNTPDLALSTISSALSQAGISVGDGSDDTASRAAQVRLSALARFELSPLRIYR